MISQSFISIAPQVPRKSLPEAALASQKFSLDPKSKRYRHSFLYKTPKGEMGRKPSEAVRTSMLLIFVRSQKKTMGGMFKTQDTQKTDVFVRFDVSTLQVFGTPGCPQQLLSNHSFPKPSSCLVSH